MRTFKLSIADIEIDIDNNNVIKRIDDKDFVNEYFDIKLSDNIFDDLSKDPMMLPFYLNNLIYHLGRTLPENNEEFEDGVRKEWNNWLTEDILIGNQLSFYEFGNKMFAHDMKDYSGKLRANGDLFQRRYDFSLPDVTITFKDQN